MASRGSHEPAAYSTQTWDAGGSGPSYSVTINPEQLRTAVSQVKSELSDSHLSAMKSLQSSLLDSDAFGMIANSENMIAQMTKFVTDHVNAMEQAHMGAQTFLLNVEAAARIGTDADPATKAEAAWVKRHIQ